MPNDLAAIIRGYEKGKENGAISLMGTKLPSLKGTPVKLRVISSSHKIVLEFLSNRKDKQSKDNQKRKGKISVKKASKAVVTPKEIHTGKGSNVSASFDPKRNAIIYHHYN